MGLTKSLIRVCVVGPDGVGKSSLASEVDDRLSDVGFVVHHLKPRPQMIDKHSNPEFDYKNPHSLKPRTFSKSFAKVVGKFGYLWFRTARSQIEHRKEKRAVVVLEERGWFDHGVDNRRYRIHPRAGSVVLGLWRWVPRADRTVVLTGDSQIIAARKNELTAEEVLRQLTLWKDLDAAGRLGAEVLMLDSTRLDLQETVDAVVEFVTQ